MIGRAGFAIFLCGNKQVGSEVIEADGVHKEFQIAVEQNVYPIPIGATGSAASSIWKIVAADRKRHFGKHAPKIKSALDTLNRSKASDQELLNAVFAIVKAIAPK